MKLFCWCDLKIWTAPIITSWNSLKRYGRFYEVTWKFALPLLSQGKIFSKIKQFCWCDLKICTAPITTSWFFSKIWGSFDDVTWKFKLSLLSQGKMPKIIRPFLNLHLKIWPAPIITSWKFCKNETVSLMWFENLNCPYYHKLKCSQK